MNDKIFFSNYDFLKNEKTYSNYSQLNFKEAFDGTEAHTHVN